MIRIPQHARFRRLGYPVLPDQFNSAANGNFSFSPQTPDSIIMQVLTQFNAQLPPDLAAKWAAAQGGEATVSAVPMPGPLPPIPSAAVTPSGQPLSTQTGAGVRLMNILNIAPNVYQCSMSDGSSHYCDVDGNPMSYTPPASAPAVTPAQASQPTAVVSPSVQPTPPATPVPGAAPVAITASGAPISSTNGGGVVQTSEQGIMAWLTGSMFGGIPNWLLAGGAALLLLGGDGGKRRR